MTRTRRILGSLVAVVALAGAVALGTNAYFSDTETSENNVLRAGAIDLKVDNHSWYNGRFILRTSWFLTDLTFQKFFDFHDLKPGDWGEDTISLHVDDNRAWACANVTLTESSENTITEPEGEDGDETEGLWAGELDEELNFVFWADDGDNVYETCTPEQVDSFVATHPDQPLRDCEPVLMEGKASDLPQGDGNRGQTFALADATGNVFQRYVPHLSEVALDEELNETWSEGPVMPLFPKHTYYIGKFWCYGEITKAPLQQDWLYEGDNLKDVYNVRRNPGTDGPGFLCNGSPVSNVSQTDKMTADVSFYAVQARNNRDFVCSSWNPNPEEAYDYLNIGDVEDEADHSLSGWSDAWIKPGWGGNYGGGSSDTSLRLLMGHGDACTEGAYGASFVMHAGSGYADQLTLEHLSGQVNDSFQVWVNGIHVDTYVYDGDPSEVWVTSTFTFAPVTGDVEVELIATDPNLPFCEVWGQVAFSNAELH